MNAPRKKILLLSLVHPDFLPPVYTAAQTLRDHNYDVHILTFDSYVVSDVKPEEFIRVESMGKHHDVGVKTRLALRRKFAARAAELMKDNPIAIISFCTFSFLTGMKFQNQAPHIYYSLEISDFSTQHFLRSPMSQISRLRTLNNVHKADMIITASVQRSAWLAGRSHLQSMPYTILNTPYVSDEKHEDYIEVFKRIVPTDFQDKKIILYTGAVNERLCVFDLVKAFDILKDDSCRLIVTGLKDNEYCNQIKAFVEKSNLQNNIKLFPYVTRTEMLALQTFAHIGVCLTREYDDFIESKMIAPNKIGEYLNKGLFIIGVRSAYMELFEFTNVGALSDTADAADVAVTLKRALDKTKDDNYKLTIKNFVKDYYCIQQQMKPILTFLNKLK